MAGAMVIVAMATIVTALMHPDACISTKVDSLITSTPEGADDDLLTTQQIAGWFGTSQQWVELGRAKGYGPPYVKLAPGIIRYKRSVVVEWLREREFKRTSEYA